MVSWLAFLNKSINAIPVKAPNRVNGECAFNSKPTCFNLPVIEFIVFFLWSYAILFSCVLLHYFS